MNTREAIIIGTRGSALALAQANRILAECRSAFSKLAFELKIIKTTGDKLQTASMAQESKTLPKGLFTKELEVALLKDQIDLAVHSLKDLPTDLPAGLTLGAVSKRADVRDVLIYRSREWLDNPQPSTANPKFEDQTPSQSNRRGFAPGLDLNDLPKGATVATSSTRRRAQLLLRNPDLHITDIRGNVATRLQKLMDRAELDATVLAMAGLSRLNFQINQHGQLHGDAVPDGLLATCLDIEVMLPCVGQGAIGIEVRSEDERIRTVCEKLNHYDTLQAVTAERAFLSGMGGGCQSPVGAYAVVAGSQLRLRAISFSDGPARRAEASRPLTEPLELGKQVAEALR